MTATREKDNGVSDFDFGGFIEEPDRREAFQELAFIYFEPAPYNPLMPFYVNFGPDSEVPEAIKNGAVAHAAHPTPQ